MGVRSECAQADQLEGGFLCEELLSPHDPDGTSAALRPASADRLDRYPVSLQGDENGGRQIGLHPVSSVAYMYDGHGLTPFLESLCISKYRSRTGDRQLPLLKRSMFGQQFPNSGHGKGLIDVLEASSPRVMSPLISF